jgi:hypothetical protein
LQEPDLKSYAAYIQDDWNVNDRLTLNVGLRWEYEPGATDPLNRISQRLDLTSPIPEMQVHLATALAVSIPLGFITAFLMTIALRARRNKIVTGEQGLVGETGVVQSALSPQGKVFVHGEIWDAVGTSELPAGQMVVVRRVDGLTLQVEALASSSANTKTSASAVLS